MLSSSLFHDLCRSIEFGDVQRCKNEIIHEIYGLEVISAAIKPFFKEQNISLLIWDFLHIRELNINGFDVSKKNTLLLLAVKHERREIFKLLLRYPKIDVNIQIPQTLETLLLEVSRRNDVELAKLLIEKRADVK